MKIANVIEIIEGAISKVESFPVMEGWFTEKEAQEQAEEMLLAKATKHGMSLRDCSIALAEGQYFTDSYEVVLHWSSINTNE